MVGYSRIKKSPLSRHYFIWEIAQNFQQPKRVEKSIRNAIDRGVVPKSHVFYHRRLRVISESAIPNLEKWLLRLKYKRLPKDEP